MPPPVSGSHLYPSTSDAAQASHSMTSTLPTQTTSTSCQPALSPPNMPCGLSSTPAGNQRASAPSRPKLTLQTRCLPRTTGTSSTGLSFSFVSGATASPTVRNTFKNAYDVPLPPSATTSPSKSSSKFSRPIPSYATNNNNSPYQLPLGVKSILRNSPLEPSSRRLSIATTGSNGGSVSRRVFFPAKKQVNYRYPLEEEIQTVHYTARHSDLIGEPEPPPSNDNGSDNDSDSNSSGEQSGSDEDTGAEGSSLGKIERKKRKQLGAQRQIRAVALMDGLEGDSYASTTPQTPQDRVKRRREWKWTLGSIEARNETFGFPRTPTKPNFDSPHSTQGAENNEIRSAERETESSISCDSDFTTFSGVSRPYSSPNSSLASPENLDDSKTTCLIDNEHSIR